MARCSAREMTCVDVRVAQATSQPPRNVGFNGQ